MAKQMKVSEYGNQYVWADRYALRDANKVTEEFPTGILLEKSFEESAKRVSEFFSQDDSEEWRNRFKELLENKLALPGGRYWANAGTGNNFFVNCWVLDVEDSRESIFTVLRQMVELMALGGGVGINISKLRPRGDVVKGVNGLSSGGCSFLDVFNTAVGTISQGGSRRGATLFLLDISHPDIEEFITAKQTPGRWENANVSVSITNDFLEAVKNDDTWELTFGGKVYKRIPAKELWDKIADSMWRSGEPGIINIDNARYWNNTEYFETVLGTNPCLTGETNILTPDGYIPITELVGEHELIDANGNKISAAIFYTGKKDTIKLCLSNGKFISCTADHQFMTIDGDVVEASYTIGKSLRTYSPGECSVISIKPNGIQGVYDFSLDNDFHWGVVENLWCHNCGEQLLDNGGSCMLASVNLLRHFKNGEFDFNSFGESLKSIIRLVDNSFEYIDYPYEYLKERALCSRHIGTGLMGLASLFYAMKIKYGSDESIKITEKILKFYRDTAYEFSSDLAKEKGSFPEFDAEQYLARPFIKTLPKRIRDKIREQGIRNAVILTQPPTGTTSLLAGCSSGHEPIFSLVTRRTDRIGTVDIVDDVFMDWINEQPDGSSILAEVIDTGHSDKIPDYFVTAQDITLEEHLAIHQLFTKYIDASVSKTLNVPNNTTKEQLSNSILPILKWVKGLTVYRDGSRSEQVLSVATKEKSEDLDSMLKEVPENAWGPKFKRVVGCGSPRIKMHVNITEDPETGVPLECFLRMGRSGSCNQAFLEGLGRLSSKCLQFGMPIELIAESLVGIKCPHPVLNPKKDRCDSCLDQVSKILQEYTQKKIHENPGMQQLCPHCGSSEIEVSDGCVHCLRCNFKSCA